jgi:predicted RNase H-related nuclease YkuK (DUF458 family)
MKKNYFKKFGGEQIEDVVEHILEYIKYQSKDNPNSNVQICIGCDSQSKSRSIIYALTIVLYDDYKHKGAHYIFKRVTIPKGYLKKNKRTSQWEFDKIEHSNYENFNMPLNDFIITKLWNEVEYLMELGLWLDEKLTDKYKIELDKNEYDGSKPYRIPIIHLDFNPDEGSTKQNKSNKLYNSAMGMFCGMGFKVVGKPNAYASSSAGDLLCKN